MGASSRLSLNKIMIRIISTVKCYFRLYYPKNWNFRTIYQQATCDDRLPCISLCLPPCTVMTHSVKRRQSAELVCAIVSVQWQPKFETMSMSSKPCSWVSAVIAEHNPYPMLLALRFVELFLKARNSKRNKYADYFLFQFGFLQPLVQGMMEGPTETNGLSTEVRNRDYTGMWVRQGSTNGMAGKGVFLRGQRSPIRVVDLIVMNP
ncbi:hypothetical protein TNCV_5124371 [Trichonephila clavipes]|nr:hypothetical protein TNCV_5124371 [Trichonephila clavipes]